jgi:hypothetical protein
MNGIMDVKLREREREVQYTRIHIYIYIHKWFHTHAHTHTLPSLIPSSVAWSSVLDPSHTIPGHRDHESTYHHWQPVRRRTPNESHATTNHSHLSLI